MNGDDPAILPDGTRNGKRFSARDYASSIIDEFCK